jgi:hypothetical protein
MTFQLLTGSTAAGVAAAMWGDAPGIVRTALHVTYVTSTTSTNRRRQPST